MIKKNILLFLIICFLLAAPLVIAKNFTVYNSSNPTQAYFSIDGTIGNVGVGTANALQKLHVVGNILANGTINATTDVCIQGGVCLSGVTTTAYVGIQNTSMFNYVNLQNASQNNWISGVYNTTRNNYVTFVNTSMFNYVNLQNTSQTNAMTAQNTSQNNYINYQDLNYNTSQTNAMTAQNTSQTNYINYNNVSVTNAINAVAAIGEPNWNANYSTFLTHATTNYVDTQNTSMKNYVDGTFATQVYVGGVNTSMKNYVDATFTTATYVNTQNTSMYNYVNLQNASQNNWISGVYNTTRNNYVTFVNTSMYNYVNLQNASQINGLTAVMTAQNTSQTNYINYNNVSVTNAINAVAAIGEPNWNANYSTFLTHATTNYVDTQNTSMKNYVDATFATQAYVGTVNTSMKNYVDATFTTATYVNTQNTSMFNYVNLQNASQINGLTAVMTAQNTSQTNYINYNNVSVTNAINAVAAIGEPNWNANYTARTGSGNVVFSTSPTFTTPTLGVATATTIDTGYGANELWDMNQHVLTSSVVSFATINTGSGAMELNDSAVANGDTNSIPSSDQVYDFVIGLGYATTSYVGTVNTSMKNYVDATFATQAYVGTVNTSMKNYVDATFTTATYVNTQNTSMFNYVNLQNASQINGLTAVMTAQNTSQTNYINYNNVSVTNAINTVAAIGEPNWNANYSTFLTHATTNYVDTQNTSMKNYVDGTFATQVYVGGVNTSMKNYVDATFTTATYVNTQNTSMYNYVNLQNASQNNWISGVYNTTRNNYVTFVNTSMYNYVNLQNTSQINGLTAVMTAQNTSQTNYINYNNVSVTNAINAVAAIGEPNWNANYTARTGSGNVVFSTSPTFTTPTLGVATATTIDTGYGANELWDMNQHVLTSSVVSFATINTGSGAMELNDSAVANGDTNSIPSSDQVYDFVIGLGYTTTSYVGTVNTSMKNYVDATFATQAYVGTVNTSMKNYVDATFTTATYVNTQNTSMYNYVNLQNASQINGLTAVMTAQNTSQTNYINYNNVSVTNAINAVAAIGEPNWNANYTARTGSGNVVFSTSPTFTTPTLGVATATTIDTGYGANELWDMNQHVLTSSAVSFATINTGSGAMELNDSAIANGDTNSIPSSDQVYDFVIGLGYGTGTMSSFVLAGSSGTNQTITNGNNLFIQAGSAITTTGVGTDIVQVGVTADSIGNTQLAYDTGQTLTTSGTPTFATLNVTGVSSGATFNSGSGNMDLGDAAVANGDTNSIPTGDQVYDFVTLNNETSWRANYTNLQANCGASSFAIGVFANGTVECRGSSSSGGSLTGAGTSGYISRWNGTVSLNNSYIYENASKFGFNTTAPQATIALGSGTPAGVSSGTWGLFLNSTYGASFDGPVNFNGATYITGVALETPLGYFADADSENRLALDYNSMIVTALANRWINHDHGAQTNPTIFVHSATSADTSNVQWASITHNTTGAVYNSGTGPSFFTTNVISTGTISGTTFSSGSGQMDLGDAAVASGDTNSIPTGGQVYTFVDGVNTSMRNYVNSLGTGMTSFTLGADSGTNQSITNGNVAYIAGSSTISTTATATDRVQLAVVGDSIGNTQLAYDTGQALTSSSSPTFVDITLSGGDINGAGNADLDIGEATASSFTFYDVTDTDEYVEFICRDSDSTNLCQFTTGAYFSAGTVYVANTLISRTEVIDDAGDTVINASAGRGVVLGPTATGLNVSTQGYLSDINAAYVYIDDSLYAAGSLYTAGDFYSTGAGDDLWLGTSTQLSSRMRLDATGNLVANGTINAYNVLINGSAVGGGGGAVANVTGGGTASYIPRWVNGTNIGNSIIYQSGTAAVLLGSSTEGLGVYVNGSLYDSNQPIVSILDSVNVTGPNVSAKAFIYWSDKRLKDNVTVINNSLDRVTQLEGVNFNWKDTGDYDMGLIAQEVEKVFPEAVAGDLSDPDSLRYLKYGNLIAPVIEAIKELDKKNKEQDNEIDELRREIDLLKLQVATLSNNESVELISENYLIKNEEEVVLEDTALSSKAIYFLLAKLF